jgi:hypothetical protein
MAVVRRPVTLLEPLAIGTLKNVDNSEALSEIISRCCSFFLTIRKGIVYFVQGLPKYAKLFNEILPDSLEILHRRIFAESLEALSLRLKREIYGLRILGFPITKAQRPIPDPLVSVTYSCIYRFGHLCDTTSATGGFEDDVRDGRHCPYLPTEEMPLLARSPQSPSRHTRRASPGRETPEFTGSYYSIVHFRL